MYLEYKLMMPSNYAFCSISFSAVFVLYVGGSKRVGGRVECRL